MQTNFAALTPIQKLVWSKDVWSAARDRMFIKKFLGTGENAMIQRITELTKTEKGEQCIMHLVADLVEDGVVGDNQRENNEEAMQSYNQAINIDLISHQVRNKGKMAEQRTVIDFRKQAKDKLAFWLANRVDQLAFQTLSGISYTLRNDGSARNGPFQNLTFAADVTAPTAKRGLMWNGSALVPSVTGSVTSSYTASYKMITHLIAYAKSHYIKPIMSGGKEYFCLFVQPGTLVQLKNDPDFLRAVTAVATKSGTDSPFFTGGTVTVDGAVIHEHNLVFNTRGTNTKWGAGNAIEGTRALLCGAQSMGMADLGQPDWVEEEFDYKTKQGISIDKMFGLLKPKFHSIYDKTVEDFGVVTCDLFLG